MSSKFKSIGKRLLGGMLGITVLLSCQNEVVNKPDFDSRIIGTITDAMTDVMVHDITNPPLAARFFAYTCLSGYEVVAQNDSSFQKLTKVLNDYPDISMPEDLGEFSVDLSAIFAMVNTASRMQPTGDTHSELKERIIDSVYALGVSDDIVQNSIKYGEYVSAEILRYASSDQYSEISNYPRYAPSRHQGTWYPTPPGYFSPVEPYFYTIRPFTLDSANQFSPLPPVEYSTDQKSEFYTLLKEVYDVDLTGENREIAAFWDCNPFALDNRGHLMVGLKKISPGAHWMGITNIACGMEDLSFGETMEITTWVAVGLMDAFMSCWHEKYRSDRIRPETAIRKIIDSKYKPFLQTPPFPEYTSGHSVISTASAVILTGYFGDDFAFTDTVELRFGLPERTYESFWDAANEAAISRLYGGIHYMDAIKEGQKQGEEVGNWVLKTKKSESGLISSN